jgi:hypothetical protein
MGLKDIFRKNKERESDPLIDIPLSKLKAGYFVDYDMKSWSVEAYNRYDWGSGDITHEWQLTSHDETIYLEREPDDEDSWNVARKIPIGKLDPGIKEHVLEHEDPPDQILFEGTTFYLDEMGGGHCYQDGEGSGRELLKWDYMDDSGKKYLSIEQWGEKDFEASIGYPVEEYQFENILPGEPEDAT